MHYSVYKEFEIHLASERIDAAEPGFSLLVQLLHYATGRRAALRIRGGVGSPDSWIEAGIIQKFPDTDAARMLRSLHGRNEIVFKPDWQYAFGDRLYQGLRKFGTTSGALFWKNFLDNMPEALFTEMARRGEQTLLERGEGGSLRDVVQSLKLQWAQVFKEALVLHYPRRPAEIQALKEKGWSAVYLNEMSGLEHLNLKEKARMGLLALDYLSLDDWRSMLEPILSEQAPSLLPLQETPTKEHA